MKFKFLFIGFLLWLLFSAIFYCVFVFCIKDWNCFNWEEGARVFYIIVVLIMAGIIALAGA